MTRASRARFSPLRESPPSTGLILLWQSRRREPRPWRAGDPVHYERRQSERG